ncbi:EAL domain-containing protein [Methylophilus sp. 3sh_L]|uniref:sensor domain-containing phosphodiesterase n=1 Tax=Methylophilus sp. 3sh_L TaxID=3377114 RepID=UPI00398E61BC
MTDGPGLPFNEGERLKLLGELCLLDSPADNILDSITKVCATVFKVPIALVSLIDEHRQWFKSKYGLAVSETPRDQAFCAYAIHEQEPMVVLNALEDPRFFDNPLVTSAPNIRFYAGAPIVIDGGKCIGTLCIIDSVPRPAFNPEEIQLLVDICAIVKERLKLLSTVGYFDALTQLPNRARFIDDIEAFLHDPIHSQPLLGLAIDVCGEEYYCSVVKALGWEYAELMLIAAKEKLKHILSAYTLYRISSTLFAVNMEAGKTAMVVQELITTFANTVEHQGIPYRFDITISTVSPDQCQDSKEVVRALITSVDLARQRNIEFLPYERSLENSTRQAFNIMMAIPNALISQTELTLHYQPKVDLVTGAVVGVEALIRWQHPEMGNIAPNVFIPLAEKTALMRRITHWVMDKGLRQAAEWQALGHTFSLALNVSAVDLDSDQFLFRLKALIETYNVNPGGIEIEFTESALMTNPMTTLQRLQVLRDMGVSLSIDDFGTGYNNLYFFKMLPATALKIDQSFIHDLQHDPKNLIIVKSLIAMAQAFGFRVVAEGIESEEVCSTLKALGCDDGQGYWIARPMPLAQFETWLHSREGHVRA